MKKILFFEPRYNSFYGAQKSMVHLIKSLESDFKVTICTTKKGVFSQSLEKEGLECDFIPVGETTNQFGGKVLDYSIFKKIIVLFQILLCNIQCLIYIYKNSIDIIYANDGRAVSYCGLAVKLARKKLVYYVRSDISPTILNKLNLKLSNKVILIAEGVLREFNEKEKLKYKNKIVTVHTGFNFDSFSILGREKLELDQKENNKVLVGYVGSLNYRKGLDILIDSLDTIISSKIKLIIAGDVSIGYEDYWSSLESKLKIMDIDYTLLGYKDNVHPLYKLLDVLVLPSRSEGLPRTVIEAMYHECAVIATNVGGVSEIIESNEIGCVIGKDSVKDLNETLSFLINNKEVMESMGKKAAIHVEQKFGQETFRRKINNLFREI